MFVSRFVRHRRRRRRRRRELGGDRLAGWWARVVAFLLDVLFTSVPGIVAAVLLDKAVPPETKLINADGSSTVVSSSRINWPLLALVILLQLVTVALTAYDRYTLQGRTGRSWGKKVAGLRLVAEDTGRPIGPGGAFVRDVGHLVDCLPLGIGWLRPIWNAKRQTYADRLAGTVVLRDA